MSKKIRTASKIAFAMYAIVMLWLLFGQRFGWDAETPYLVQLKEHYNFIPFKTILLFMRLVENSTSQYWIRHALINLLGNVVMFVPLGLLPCIFTKLRSSIKYLSVVALIIFAIETVQLFTLLGSMDIDDFLLNIVGALIGYLLFRLAEKHVIF